MAKTLLSYTTMGKAEPVAVSKEDIKSFMTANGLPELKEEEIMAVAFPAYKNWGKVAVSVCPNSHLVYAEMQKDDGAVIFAIGESSGLKIGKADAGAGVKPVGPIKGDSPECDLAFCGALAYLVGSNDAFKQTSLNDVAAAYGTSLVAARLFKGASLEIENGNISIDEGVWKEIKDNANVPLKNPHCYVSAAKAATRDTEFMTPGLYDGKKLGFDTSSLELEKIPTSMGNGFVPFRMIAEKARTWHESVKLFGEAICNFGLRGDAGSGKSVGAKYFAFLTGLPFYRFLCTVNMDEQAMYGGYQPRTERSFAASGLPTFEDIEMDWKDAWRRLTGKEPDNTVDRSIVYKELNRRMGEDDTNFIFVYSEFMKAVMYGGVLEVGEAEIVKQQGALTALNNILEKGAGAFFTLPNGKTVRRHPLFVPIFTTNDGYAGCKPLNESVLSRLDELIDVPTPGIDELVNRVSAQCTDMDGNPLFEDEVSLRTMATVLEEIRTHALEDPSLGGGSVGARELLAWAKKCLLLQMRETNTFGKPQKKVSADNQIRAAFTTVLSKCSADPEGREVLSQIFEQRYTPGDVQRIKTELGM